MKDLEPIFCSICGCRIGWNDVSQADCDLVLVCDDCKKETE